MLPRHLPSATASLVLPWRDEDQICASSRRAPASLESVRHLYRSPNTPAGTWQQRTQQEKHTGQHKQQQRTSPADVQQRSPRSQVSGAADTGCLEASGTSPYAEVPLAPPAPDSLHARTVAQ
jgi:hypothetical protein